MGPIANQTDRRSGRPETKYRGRWALWPNGSSTSTPIKQHLPGNPVLPSSPSPLDHNPTTIQTIPPPRPTNPHKLNPLTDLLPIQVIPQACISIPHRFCLDFSNMSSANVYSIDDFSLYLMPKSEAPVCPPCQSGTLPSVFEDDEDDEIVQAISVLSKANKLIKKILIRTKLPPRVKSSSSNFFSPSRLRSLTLSSQGSRIPTNSLHSSNSD
ncbi:hypothetical protein PGT21_021233 [Puccinia graminis f. sp. tritici]|uniref:Uncharacterized protein n=1 Tax=Puccinia graminis f. sp. tritici TaxID=56615 RepID=A0A5B0M362_PUCGR|nr:hypothetical protein PGT21_021233 [Puccinia graminis f. sp. tritici]